MKNLIGNILDLARLKGVSYADIRVVRREFEEIEVKNGNVEALTHDEDFGFGIRLLYRGAWGFACSSKMTRGEMERALGKALKVAKASASVQGKPVSFPLAPPITDRYRAPYSVDPFDVSIEKKLDLLLRSEETMRKNRKVKISEAFMGSYKTEKIFASTEGSFIEQELVECGAGIGATAIEEGEVQVRSLSQLLQGEFCDEGLRVD